MPTTMKNNGPIKKFVFSHAFNDEGGRRNSMKGDEGFEGIEEDMVLIDFPLT